MMSASSNTIGTGMSSATSSSGSGTGTSTSITSPAFTPWLGGLAIVIAGIAGYVLSDASPGETLEAVVVEIRPQRDSGAGWDFGGGMPDPRVRVEQAGKVLATCEAKDVVKLTCAVGKPI